MAGGPNLFARLHKWAARQDENFHTESLAIVLEHLLISAPEVGTRVISQLTDGFIDVAPEDAGSIDIRPQVETGEGRPDLQIRVPHRLVWVEVKVESPLRTGQLEGYRELLGRAEVSETRLVLLTRYPQMFRAEDARPDSVIRWYELADSLESELPALEASGEVILFVVQQFLEFLRTKGMTLTHVDKYLPDGLRALGSLLNMLTEAAAACNVPVKQISAGSETIGHYLDGGKYWVGLSYAEPEALRFCTCHKIDPNAAMRLGGKVTEERWCPTRHVWWQEAELNSDTVHFYSRSKVRQMEWLESFLRDSVAKARSIETRDESPNLERPQEN